MDFCLARTAGNYLEWDSEMWELAQGVKGWRKGIFSSRVQRNTENLQLLSPVPAPLNSCRRNLQMSQVANEPWEQELTAWKRQKNGLKIQGFVSRGIVWKSTRVSVVFPSWSLVFAGTGRNSFGEGWVGAELIFGAPD